MRAKAKRRQLQVNSATARLNATKAKVSHRGSHRPSIIVNNNIDDSMRERTAVCVFCRPLGLHFVRLDQTSSHTMIPISILNNSFCRKIYRSDGNRR